ncbi:DUF5677 domain-containing protein [Streptomyces sp. ID05-18]|uniref:DUF5677 domain-containing protein n=1 Tax=Streptomyces sp. ID05-18 TaxID=3028662 RepID=UPI0029BD9AC8|nr:DUF5677 domain-containing protein [Streptomyces sp. ID05-18]MDX3486617.1 DUF5677 domain-containing protein [Streptomyces sp. ID05-18]
MTELIAAEVERVNNATRFMISVYCAWGSEIENGETHLFTHTQLLEFVNLRIETADSCLLLIENGKVADSLGLSRSLLENYLLFMLMCRGRKYFQLRDLSGEKMTAGQFKARVAQEQEKLKELRRRGETDCIEVKRYTKAKDRLMYVFEGLKSKDDPSVIHPVHLVHFQEFHPETMRLKDENYFQYYQHDKETKKAIKGHVDAEAWRYKHYLSYDALLHSLEINGIIDTDANARIEAHYTFLGKFVHPAHDAARDLRDQSNWHGKRTSIGLEHPYSDTSALLASLYVSYLVAGLLDEAATLIENAPDKYISNAGTTNLRKAVSRVSRNFPYFWFLFNDPPQYDRFMYCIHHVDPEDVKNFGGYSNVPLKDVPFNQHIYDNLKHSLYSARTTLYSYRSPLPGMQ